MNANNLVEATVTTWLVVAAVHVVVPPLLDVDRRLLTFALCAPVLVLGLVAAALASILEPPRDGSLAGVAVGFVAWVFCVVVTVLCERLFEDRP